MQSVHGYGIDVSHHQGLISWKDVAQKGIISAGNLPVNFAVLKCIYEANNHNKDEFFDQNYDGCIKNAINVGVYMYHARTSLQDPISEAKSLIKALNGRKIHIGIWHDLEDKNLKAAGNDAINNLIKTEDEILKAAGYTDIGIYCNKDWYDHVLDSKYLKSEYKYWWIARYLKNDSGKIPPDSMSPVKYANAWQFSSKGKVSGINTNVDLDIDYTGLAAQMLGDSPKEQSGSTSSNDLGIKAVSVTNSLNVRRSPELGDNIIGQLPNGTKVNVTQINGKWAKIEGWVSTNYLK